MPKERTTTWDTATPGALRPGEGRVLVLQSDTSRLARAIIVTLLVCTALAALAFLVGEQRVVEWAWATGGQKAAGRTALSRVLRAPRFIMYGVFVVCFIIGVVRKQRVWVHVALMVLLLELVVAGAAVRVLKWAIGRARPNIGPGFKPFNFADDYQSFPSGESADIAVSVSFFLYFARTWRVRAVALLAMAMVIFERLMRGEHYPSDVLASAYFVLFASFVVWHWFVVGFPTRTLRKWFGQEPAPLAAAHAEAGEVAAEAGEAEQ